MYKYRPAFSNNPKVHYHATAEQVSEPGRICSQLTLGNMELRINSLQGSGECQSVKVNNSTWHCCVIVYIFAMLLMKTCLLSQLSSVELDTSVLLTGMHCCFTSVSAWSWDAEKCHLPLASPDIGANSGSLQRELGMLSAFLDQTL